MHTLKRALAPVLVAATVAGGAALAPAAPAGGALLPVQPDSFQMATFNVLGGSHAARRSGVARTKGVLRYLKKHSVSVVGLQEFEPKQYAAFMRVHRRDVGRGRSLARGAGSRWTCATRSRSRSRGSAWSRRAAWRSPTSTASGSTSPS